MPKIRLHRIHQNLWTAAGQHIHRKPGDFDTLTGLLPTLDRQELRRAPALSSHLTHSGLTAVEGIFYDAPNARTVLSARTPAASSPAPTSPPPGPTPAPPTPSTPPSPPWTASASATTSTPTATSGSSPTPSSCAPTTTPASALSTFDTTDGQLISYVGGRVYLIQDDCRIYRMMTDGSLLEGHFNPADDLVPIFATGLKDDLLIVCSLLNGELRVLRTVAYAKTSIRKLEDMAVLPNDTGDYPSAGCPFCVHDNDLWLLSGAHPNPDGTVTRDLLAYTGYRVERVARIPDASASPSSIGLLTWRGELLYYELTTTSAAFKLLVGNHFVDFLSPTFSASGMTPIAASCGGEIILTGKSGSDEGIYHAGGSALQDGSLETSWHDGDRPGVEKRLLNITATVKGATGQHHRHHQVPGRRQRRLHPGRHQHRRRFPRHRLRPLRQLLPPQAQDRALRHQRHRRRPPNRPQLHLRRGEE